MYLKGIVCHVCYAQVVIPKQLASSRIPRQYEILYYTSSNKMNRLEK